MKQKSFIFFPKIFFSAIHIRLNINDDKLSLVQEKNDDCEKNVKKNL